MLPVTLPGSPYHMILDSIDTTGLGGTDRQLMTSAIFFSPAITTNIEDGTNAGCDFCARGDHRPRPGHHHRHLRFGRGHADLQLLRQRFLHRTD